MVDARPQSESTMMTPHQIGRLTLVLRAPDPDQAQTIQDAAAVACRTDLMTRLSALFDEVAGDRVVRLDRVEVDLERFEDPEGFRKRFSDEVENRLRERLTDLLARETGPLGAAPSADERSIAALQQPGFGETDETGLQVLTPEAQAAEAFLSALAAGRMPWTAPPGQFDQVAERMPELLRRSPALTDRLRKLLSASTAARQRLLTQPEPTHRSPIIAALTGFSNTDFEALETALEQFSHSLNVRPQSRYLNRMLEIAVGADGSRSLTDAAFVETVITDAVVRAIHLLRSRVDTAREVQEVVRRAAASPPSPWHLPFVQAVDRLIAEWSAAGKEPKQAEMDLSDSAPLEATHPPAQDRLNLYRAEEKPISTETTILRTTPSGEAGAGDPAESAVNAAVPAPLDSADSGLADAPYEAVKSDPSATQAGGESNEALDAKPLPGTPPTEKPAPLQIRWLTAVGETIHLHNAGLVILAPFFRQVFGDLGYLDETRQYTDDAARTRAIHFTQYLVTERPHPAECDLVLNKILCGADPETPIDRFLPIHPAEAAAAAELIASAISHWKTLKRTSPPVFRETFLQHFGILDRRGESWRLRIERTAVDLLIDTLPWTISVIRHPWMTRPLMVEW